MKIAPFILERFFAKHEFTARHLLCTSDCESMSLGDLLALQQGAQDAFLSLHLGYTESPGAPELRESISRLYANTPAEAILVHTGAEEAIFTFMNGCLSPGDEIVVHAPCYQSLMELPRAIGCTAIPWQARAEQEWQPDLGELRTLITPATRAVVVNSPHNPTGWHMSASFQQELVDICSERSLYLFADEVYRGLEYDGISLPGTCDLYSRAVSLGVMSKSYGLAGLRIGWAATRDEELYAAMASFKDYTTICNPAPSEFLARVALDNAPGILSRTRSLCQDNLALLTSFMEEHSELFGWVPPKAGPICFPWLLRGDVQAFCEGLLKERGVLLAPAGNFQHPAPCFRVGFGRKDFAECLDLLERYVAESM